MLKDILKLIFPPICTLCHRAVKQSSTGICHSCEGQIEFIEKDHPFMQQWHNRLYARFPINWYQVLFDLNSNAFGLKLIQSIKYQQVPELGRKLGERLGEQILACNRPLPELIIPMPLHPEKERRRGYNQALAIAQGLSDVCQIPVNPNVVKRTKHQKSQTQLNRWERQKNIANAFECTQAQLPSLLLVDDVLTTGSTLESLWSCLPKQTKISVATLGVA